VIALYPLDEVIPEARYGLLAGLKQESPLHSYCYLSEEDSADGDGSGDYGDVGFAETCGCGNVLGRLGSGWEGLGYGAAYGTPVWQTSGGYGRGEKGEVLE
jgi:hypothetical protein